METEKDLFDNIQTDLSDLLLYIEFIRRKDKRMGQLDRSAYRLLAALSEKGPMGINALANKFLLDKSTMSRQTAALVSKGYIRRIPDPNEGRVSLLEVTPIGRDIFQEVRMARKLLYRNLLDDWSESDRKQLETYLSRLNQAIIGMVKQISAMEEDQT